MYASGCVADLVSTAVYRINLVGNLLRNRGFVVVTYCAVEVSD